MLEKVGCPGWSGMTQRLLQLVPRYEEALSVLEKAVKVREPTWGLCFHGNPRWWVETGGEAHGWAHFLSRPRASWVWGGEQGWHRSEGRWYGVTLSPPPAGGAEAERQPRPGLGTHQ